MSVEPSQNTSPLSEPPQLIAWRDTVRAIYDELHFGEDSVFGGSGRDLARRLLTVIEDRHGDYFCQAIQRGTERD